MDNNVTDSQPTPPALPADMPPELLRGVTIQPVKFIRELAIAKCVDGKHRSFECVTAVLFEKP